jgi:hypothetical protein
MNYDQSVHRITAGTTAGLIHMSSASRNVARRPHFILKNVIRRLERQDDWVFATRQAPAILSFSLNLARYLTESVPAVNGSRPLLESCIGRGIDSWFHAAAKTKSEQVKLLSFIRGVLYPLPEALEWTLSWDTGENVTIWNPMEECVCDWWTGKGGIPEAMRRKRPHDSAYIELNLADFRFIVLVRFLARDPIFLGPLSARFDDLVTRYG